MHIVIIGSGVAGLSASRALSRCGHEVTVLDKGRRAGGRLASRNLAHHALADHGAQFFTARSESFQAQVDAWIKEGFAREWCRGFGVGDRHPRYSAPGGMARLAGRIAEGQDVRQSVHVDAVQRRGRRWRVSWPAARGAQAASIDADILLLTAPVPQSAALLEGVVEIPDLE